MKYGALTEGRAGKTLGLTAKTKRKPAGDGWRLTASGIEWIKENQQRFEKFVKSGQVKDHRQKVLRELKRIKNHPLYTQYSDSPDRFYPAIGDIADLLRCRVDTEEEIWKKRFETIQSKARVTEQPEILKFIDLCRQACIKQR